MAAYYNEINKYCAQWLRNLIAAGHIAPGDVDERSIEDVRPSDLRGYTQCHFFAGVGVWSYALRLAGWPDDRPVWTGSCPCQPFSAAGKGLGFADERHLWPAFFHLIKERRPAKVLGEQVASKDADPWIDALQLDLEGLGYAVGAVPFPSAGVGAPHIRDRLYWVADADSERFARVGGSWKTGVAQHSKTCRLGFANSTGRQQGRIAATSAGHRNTAVAASHICGMADADIDGLQGRAEQAVFGEGRRQERHEAGCSGTPLVDEYGATGPTNGHWRDADWLFCRDGKWRPVVATHVALVDGSAPSMVRMRTGSSLEENKNKEIKDGVQELRQSTDTEAIRKRGAGIPIDAQAQEILRQKMHGEQHDQGSVQQRQSQSHEIGINGEGIMRSLREGGETPCTSPGRESTQQRCRKFEDIVCLLSPSLSLAKLHGDRRTENELLALQRAIYQEGSVRHSSQSVQEVWASLGEETKDRIRLGFDASRWAKLVAFPLERGARSRVGRLRAYGNAINAKAAQIFIEAVMDDRLVA